MNCAECKELLVGFIEGYLDESERLKVSEHLSGCSSCKVELTKFEKLHGRLVSNGKAFSKSDFEENVFSRIVREQKMRLKQAGSTFKLWRIIMKSPIAKLAAAAVIIIAVLISINQFGGSIDGASRAFAAVVENVKKAKTISMTIIYIEDGNEIDIFSIKVMVMEPYFQRGESTDGKIWIFDLQQERVLKLDTITKAASMSSSLYEPVNIYDTFKNFLQLEKYNAKKIGPEIIDDRKAEVFELTDENNSQIAKIWVDPQTLLPFRIECNIESDLETPYEKPRKRIYNNIVFDEEMDKSLFSLDVPEGYKIVESMPTITATEGTSKSVARVKSAMNMHKILSACLIYADETMVNGQSAWIILQIMELRMIF